MSFILKLPNGELCIVPGKSKSVRNTVFKLKRRHSITFLVPPDLQGKKVQLVFRKTNEK